MRPTRRPANRGPAPTPGKEGHPPDTTPQWINLSQQRWINLAERHSNRVVIGQEHSDSSAGAGAEAFAGRTMVRVGVDAVGRTRWGRRK